MGVSCLRERYRVDLPGLQSACEINYARLMRLLPEMRKGKIARSFALSGGEQRLGVLLLEVVDVSPYTTTLRVHQQQHSTWLQSPRFEVRVYHDARMAEVVRVDNIRCLRGLYLYPNPDMHQPDEKTQLNLFLGEWLTHCLACGHELETQF